MSNRDKKIVPFRNELVNSNGKRMVTTNKPLDISLEPSLCCPVCYCEGFLEVWGHKLLSALVSPSGVQQVARALAGMYCVTCGYIGDLDSLEALRPDVAQERRNQREADIGNVN